MTLQSEFHDKTHNQAEYSISELSTALKRVVEMNFDHVRLRGEISGFKRAASGHLYMSLKDHDAVISAICWKGMANKIALSPEDGLEVIVTGKVTTYPGRSQYQIIIESMELAGEGAILKMLEERKKKLAAEGLFDADRKKPLPILPKCIAVITSPTGAVIHDICTTLERRFPRHVMLAPVKVQGEGAAAEITRAINSFTQLAETQLHLAPDLLIVARGGGSLEDLLPFSEESVVRAVADCPIPIISSVGHETDTMLIDYAADRRAPTPTAAAEMAVPVRDDILRTLNKEEMRMQSGLQKILQSFSERVTGLARGLINPATMVMNMGQRLDSATERLSNSTTNFFRELENRLPDLRAPTDLWKESEARLAQTWQLVPPYVSQIVERQSTRVEAAGRLLESFSYKNVLDRGFVLVRNKAGDPVLSANGVSAGDDVSLTFKDGNKQATISGNRAKAPPKRKKPTPPAANDGSNDQGSLL